MSVVFGLAILLISLVLHENAHAIVANRLGDTTAKDAGRITLNPVKHLDIVGSLILPVFLFLTSGTAFGYAKPVPVNRFRLRGQDRGFALVALAGPVSNILIALVAILVLRFGFGTNLQEVAFGSSQRVLGSSPWSVVGLGPYLLFQTFNLNLFLAAFNLIPIPPLDGSRLLRPFVGAGGVRLLDRIEPYGFVILFGVIYLLRDPFFVVVQWIASLIIKILPV